MAVAAADGDHPVSGNALCAELFHRPGRPCTRAQKQARQAQSVYALECAGQQWLAELDAALAQAGGTAELDALLPHGTAREGPGVSAVLEGADGRSLSVFAELTADGGYRVIQWQQSAEWAGEAEAPALFGTLREG